MFRKLIESIFKKTDISIDLRSISRFIIRNESVILRVTRDWIALYYLVHVTNTYFGNIALVIIAC